MLNFNYFITNIICPITYFEIQILIHKIEYEMCAHVKRAYYSVHSFHKGVSEKFNFSTQILLFFLFFPIAPLYQNTKV